jgi:hypothetical protein
MMPSNKLMEVQAIVSAALYTIKAANAQGNMSSAGAANMTKGNMNPNGSGTLVPPLQQFMTNPDGAAIVNTVGPIRQIVQENVPPRYLVIVPGTAKQHGAPVQVQLNTGRSPSET